MPTPKQIEEIARIQKAYVEKVAPLVEDLEHVQGYDVSPLHNEVRAIMGHLSRCYEEKRRSVSEEIRKALGHLDRLTLDTYKVYALYFTEIESDYEETYKWVDLSMIDNHGFYETYFKLSCQGKKYRLEARKQESINKKDSLLAYEKMYAFYHKMMDYLSQHESAMRVQKLKYMAGKFLAILGMFLLTSLAVLFGDIILSCITCK